MGFISEGYIFQVVIELGVPNILELAAAMWLGGMLNRLESGRDSMLSEGCLGDYNFII